MPDESLAYGTNVCATEPFLSSSTEARAYANRAAYTPASSPTRMVTLPGQSSTPDAGDLIGHILGITEEIQRADRRTASACAAVEAAARRDFPRFLAGLAAVLVRGMFEAARSWISDLVDLATAAYEFVTEGLADRLASAGFQAIAAIGAVELMVGGHTDALKKVSALMQETARSLVDDSGVLAQLLVAASHRMLTVAGYIETIQKMQLTDVLELVHELVAVVAEALVGKLETIVSASNDAHALGDGVGALMGRVVGEVVLVAVGL